MRSWAVLVRNNGQNMPLWTGKGAGWRQPWRDPGENPETGKGKTL